MKKNIFINIWLFILVIILILLSIWGLFYIENVDSKIAVFGTVALIIAAFTSIMTVNINNNKIKEREYHLHILKEKQRVFNHFYNYYSFLVLSAQNKEKRSKWIGEDELVLFRKGLINWGSEDLIHAFIKYEDQIIESSYDHKVFLEVTNKLLRKLRDELGFEDSENIKLVTVLFPPDDRREIDY